MKKVNLISLSGKIGSGKNTVASIIQYLVWKNKLETGEINTGLYDLKLFLNSMSFGAACSGWEQKSFAAKLKHIASILTGIPAERFEDQEFKKTELGEEWARQLNGAELHSLWIQAGGGIPATKEQAVFQEKVVKPKFDELKAELSNPYTVRKFLQRLGTEAVRNNIHPNTWVNALFADYTPNYGNPMTEAVYGHGSDMSWPNWIITDCRFPNEIEAVKQRGGICIRVEKPNTVLSTHASETALDNHQFDYTIQNTGTIDDLVLEVEKMLKHFKLL